MWSKITDQRLLTIIILVFLLMQFVLTVTGHARLDNYLHLISQGQAVSCQQYPFADAVESKNH